MAVVGTQEGSVLRVLEGSFGLKERPMNTPRVKREFTFVIASRAVMWTEVMDDERVIFVCVSVFLLGLFV